MNKRLPLFLLTTILFTAFASAQDAQTIKKEKNKFAIKVQTFKGSYLDKNHHFKGLGLDENSGLNLGIELPAMQQRPWQQYLNNPTFGVGLTHMNFENDMVGHMIAMYPYIMLPLIRCNFMEFNIKLAPGLGVVTEHWYTQEDQNPDHYGNYENGPTTDPVFGCYVNAYLTAGANLNIILTRNVKINAEFGYSHMSNGRTFMPNLGANVIYGGLGLITTFNADAEKEPIQFPGKPYKWSLNITGAAGPHQAAIKDGHRFLTSTFHAGAIYQATNWYGVGIGLDVFYNGAITSETDRSLYRKDHVYTTAEKFRAGLSWDNEFQFGRVTAIADWGVYFYNPSRHYYDCNHPIYGYGKRPLFYKNDGAGNDEAFHYIRFGVKTRVWDNLYLQATCKTHLHIAEYVEFGIGYQIPFLKKDKRSKGKSIIYHHNKNWWK